MSLKRRVGEYSFDMATIGGNIVDVSQGHCDFVTVTPELVFWGSALINCTRRPFSVMMGAIK